MRSVGIDVVACEAGPEDKKRVMSLWKPNDPQIFGLPVLNAPFSSSFEKVFVVKVRQTREIIGFSQIKVIDFHGEKTACIASFSTRKDLRKRGIGKKLLGKINAYLLAHKVRHVQIRSTNTGLKFYSGTNYRPSTKEGIDFEWFPQKKPVARKRPIAAKSVK